ncbi:MAG: FkbM family methyltransferase [Clostridia bacterium]|nr:FkbM family methyltransferase [Clostridia bacterium]
MIFPFSEPMGDLWQYLASTEKTVVMYGMGNGADKILAVCEKFGIEVADFFASDGFVRGHSFHGKRVLSYTEVKEKYGAENLIVLLSFASSLPDVLALFDRVASECELYAPDVPVCGENLFDLAFYRAHREELSAVYSLLADEESRRIFECVLRYKLSGSISELRAVESTKDETYTLLTAQNIRTAADLGAYNGDTVRELKNYAPELSEVWAFEPDRRSFRKLSEFAETVESPKIHTIHAAAWSEDTTLSFADTGNRNAGAFALGKQIEVEAKSLDGVLGGTRVDYIKYDVEGAEREAILGSEETIRKHHPRLLVSIYHRSEDLFALPLLFHEKFPEYRLYLRRTPYVPAWDLNLICL